MEEIIVNMLNQKVLLLIVSMYKYFFSESFPNTAVALHFYFFI